MIASKLLVTLPTMALAFQTVPSVTRGVAVKGAKEELVEYANSNPTPASGFWDPLGLADKDFWGMGNEATIGFLRHSEIKHGRIAMAGFVGFCAQSTPFISGPHAVPPYRGYVPGVTPQEQWDNIPFVAKAQIFCLIGMLESYGEGAGYLVAAGDEELSEGYVHYTKGGKPGYFPPIKGKAFGQIQFNLFDPFDSIPPASKTEEAKAKGLLSELNNGRLAMIGLLGLLSESSTPGSVPFLSGISTFPRYSGEVMAPFEANLQEIPAWTYFHP